MLWDKVRKLISDIPDNRIRFDAASTINFLFDVYASGGVDEDSLKNDLRDICQTIISITNPLLSPDDVKDKVETLVNDLVNVMKIESLVRRTRARVSRIIREF